MITMIPIIYMACSIVSFGVRAMVIVATGIGRLVDPLPRLPLLPAVLPLVGLQHHEPGEPQQGRRHPQTGRRGATADQIPGPTAEQ